MCLGYASDKVMKNLPTYQPHRPSLYKTESIMNVMDLCVSFFTILSVGSIAKLELDFLYNRIFKELFQKLNQFSNVYFQLAAKFCVV